MRHSFSSKQFSVTLPLAIVNFLATPTHAAVQNASVSSTVSSYDGRYLSDTNHEFGTHSLYRQGLATTTIGADASGTPFISFEATTPNSDYSPGVGARLDYNWKISSNNGSTDRVLVHISTTGWIDSSYVFTADQPGVYNFNGLNRVDMGVRAVFATNSYLGNSLYGDERSYGLVTGGAFNWGVPGVRPVTSFTERVGGTSTVHGEFDQTFDIWVRPNTVNFIRMEAAAGLYDQYYAIKQYGKEEYSFKGYIDPVITIDPAYSGNYTLEVSNIPFAPVPVPAAAWLFGTGLLGLVGLKRQRQA